MLFNQTIHYDFKKNRDKAAGSTRQQHTENGKK